MQKKFVSVALLLWAGHVCAADDTWQSIEQIRTAARNYAATALSPGAEVIVGALDDRLHLPACETPLQASSASGNPQRGAVNVGVRCSGVTSWTLYVPVRINAHLQVVVLKRSLARGDAINADALELREVDAATLPYGYFTNPEQATGKILKRSLPPGSALTPDNVESPSAIKRGQRVTICGKSGLAEVRAEGKAMADAADGDRVRVENISSRRIVEGIAHSSGEVEIRL